MRVEVSLVSLSNDCVGKTSTEGSNWLRLCIIFLSLLLSCESETERIQWIDQTVRCLWSRWDSSLNATKRRAQILKGRTNFCLCALITCHGRERLYPPPCYSLVRSHIPFARPLFTTRESSSPVFGRTGTGSNAQSSPNDFRVRTAPRPYAPAAYFRVRRATCRCAPDQTMGRVMRCNN